MTHTPDMTAGFGAANTTSNSAEIQREFDSDMAYLSHRIERREHGIPIRKSDNIADIAIKATLMLKEYTPLLNDNNGEPVGFVPVHENGEPFYGGHFDPDQFTEFVVEKIDETLEKYEERKGAIEFYEKTANFRDLVKAVRDEVKEGKRFDYYDLHGRPFVGARGQQVDFENSPGYHEEIAELRASGALEEIGLTPAE